MILYSIIIAVYNVEKYLEECLDSILAQSYTNWEVILVDDGSTDSSAAICDKYVSQDSRFRVFHRVNEGSLMSRRYGLKQAQGEFILFPDSDDYLDKDLLLSVNEIIEKNSCDLVIYRLQRFDGLSKSDSRIVFDEGTIIGKDGLPKEELWKKVMASSDLHNLCLKVTKRENAELDKDFSEYAFLESGTDMMQSLPILQHAKKIYFTEKVLYFYRYNANGISSSKQKKTDPESIKKHLETRRVLLNEKLRYLKKNHLDTEVYLKLYYATCFSSGTELLIAWLDNTSGRHNKEKIIKMMLEEQDFIDGKRYLQANDFSGQYRILYRMFLNGDFRMKILLEILARKRGINAMVYEWLKKLRCLKCDRVY